MTSLICCKYVIPNSAMSACTIPRLGIAPLIGEKTVLSEVRFNSKMLSPVAGIGSVFGLCEFNGRKIVLNPRPLQLPAMGASGPRSLLGNVNPGLICLASWFICSSAAVRMPSTAPNSKLAPNPMVGLSLSVAILPTPSCVIGSSAIPPPSPPNVEGPSPLSFKNVSEAVSFKTMSRVRDRPRLRELDDRGLAGDRGQRESVDERGGRDRSAGRTKAR